VIQSDELTALLIATAVLTFMVMHRRELGKLPAAHLLMASYFCLFLGLVSTVLEGLFWGEGLNTFEHLSNMASSILLAAWLWRLFREKRNKLWPS